MSNPSNLYAEKIFSEHPIIMWALDDNADYISLISEAERDIDSAWSIVNGTASLASVLKEPFINSHTNLITGDFPTTFPNDVLMVSPYLFNFNELSSNPGNLSIGTYFYSDSSFLESITIGYLYTHPTTNTLTVDSKTIDVSVYNKWSFISEVFPVLNLSTDVSILISLNFKSGGSSSDDYKVYLNGITVGQFAENSNTQSLGVTQISIPSSIAIPASTGIEAFSYGSIEDNGYYLSKNNVLLARNTGVPLVYGATNITKLLPNTSGTPSLIVPGKGFLNNSGRYQDYTVEFWARIDCYANKPKRIFGPIASTDGLYVENGYMTLQIGKDYKTYFISEWFRPMLIDIRIIKNKAIVLLNSEEIINMDIDMSKLSLPNEFDQNGKNQNWLGFYAYEDVSPIEIDCVAIYPYNVSQTIAKRRMVYAQAVAESANINASYDGKSAYIDYAFADYTSNYNYPDFANWEQGTYNNLKVTKNGITTPDYALPQIFLGNKTLQQFYDDSKAMPAYRYTYENLVENPSFTLGTNDWYNVAGTSTATFQRQTTGGTDNGPCLKITQVSSFATWSGVYTYPTTGAGYFLVGGSNKGTQLKFSVKAVNGPFTPKVVVGRFNYLLQLQANDTYTFRTIYPEEGWVTFDRNISTVPGSSSATTFFIGYVTFGPTVSQNSLQWLLDDVMLYQRPSYSVYEPYLPYFDGEKNNFPAKYNASVSWSTSWNQYTPHNGTSLATVDYDWIWREGHRPVSFRPNSSWNNEKCYLHYNKYAFMNDPIEAIYTVFVPTDLTTEQTLFKVYNTSNGAYFRCYIKDGSIKLGFDIENFTWTEVYAYSSFVNIPTFAGLKLTEMLDYAFYNEYNNISSLRPFFANPSLLKMYVGGDEDGNTFKGSFYGVFIDTVYHQDNLVDSTQGYSGGASYDALFNIYGAPLWSNQNGKVEARLAEGSSYGLKPVTINDQFKLDIEIIGEWSDYLPLTYFAQYVLDKNGNKIYDLDFIQFNVNLPEDPNFTLAKTYVTFQYIAEGGNKQLKAFSEEVDLGDNRVLDLNNYPNWRTTKFRILDGTIIYPRTDVAFDDLSISYYIPFKVPASLTKNANVKRLEFASEAFDNNSFNTVGTRSGIDIYPYKKTGFYYDNKGKNPFVIYKGSTPYLYLTKKTGIKSYKLTSDSSDRGLSIPINSELASDYDVGGLQLWMYCDDIDFSENGSEIFNITHKGGKIGFYGVPVNTSGDRIKIYAIDKNTGMDYYGLAYYLNGVLVKDPVISKKEWSVLGVSFLPVLSFTSFMGSVNVVNQILFNNISTYKAKELQQTQSSRFRLWSEVKNDGLSDLIWSYWLNNYIWEDVLIVGNNLEKYVDPSAIYNTYIGTNKIIIDDNEGLGISIDKMDIRKEVNWSTSTQSAV